MDNRLSLSPTCVTAQYTPQRLPQYKDNPFIEALPPVLTDEQLYELLTIRPEFSAEQREWSTVERIQMLETLGNFRVPFARHVSLARAIDGMLRAGYIGRLPNTPEHARRFQAIYDRQKNGGTYKGALGASAAQISALLMGLSGMGKTSSVKTWFSHIPQVIYHPIHPVYQVTYLHIEMPSDGSSIKGLAHAILEKMDRLIPGATYYETYTRGKPGADTLMRSVARVLNMHFVGFLVADEIQNLTNAHKGKQIVMTELVSACNDLSVPILFIGTNKASKVFSLDFRKSRRASGHGIAPWDRLPETVCTNEINEWQEFLAILWSFQWVRKPVELSERHISIMYDCSQGVIDIAIKLFAAAQARAMLDGTERLTPELIANTYKREMHLLHPMIEALRRNDIERLMQFEDIAPPDLCTMLESIAQRVRAKASNGYRIKPGDSAFIPNVATALVAAGIEEEEAVAAAEAVVSDGNAKHLLQGTQKALAKVTAIAPVPRAKGASDKEKESVPNFQARPLDYRNAIVKARQEKSNIYEQLRALKMARPLDELLDLA